MIQLFNFNLYHVSKEYPHKKYANYKKINATICTSNSNYNFHICFSYDIIFVFLNLYFPLKMFKQSWMI